MQLTGGIRTLAEITADALLATCGDGDCWARPGCPCSSAPAVHIARYRRARRKGLISAEDMAFVVASLIAAAVPVIVTPAEHEKRAA